MTHRRVHLTFLAACCALVLTVSACGGDDDDDAADSPTTTTLAAGEGEEGESNVTEAEAQAYVGLTVEEADAQAAEAGHTTRIIKQDGEDLPATMDFDPDRVNFAVEDGVVTEVTTG